MVDLFFFKGRNAPFCLYALFVASPIGKMGGDDRLLFNARISEEGAEQFGSR